MPDNSPILQMVETGMIQFGYFTSAFGEPATPIQFHFSLLPSFPTLMNQIADMLQSTLETVSPDTRLLATENTVGLGAVLAVKTNIPLLYPHGNPLQFTNAFTIEGTADVDNPIILITDVIIDGELEQHMHTMSRRIGLPVHQTLALLTAHQKELNFPYQAIFTLDDVLDTCLANGIIQPSMANAIKNWRQP